MVSEAQGATSPTNSFSCTAVAILHNGTIESAHFWDLNIPTGYIAERRGVKSIMLGTLLQAIVPQSHFGHVAHTSGHLPTILSGASVSVDVATTRVPIFDSTIQSPEYGFRVLRSLRSTDFQAMHHTGASIDAANEILALDPIHTLSAAYGCVWAPFDMYLPHHFIIVFMVPNSTQFPAILPAPSLQATQIGSQDLLGYHSSHVSHMDHPSTEFSSSLLSLASGSYSHSPSPIPSTDFSASGAQASPSFGLDLELHQFLAENAATQNQDGSIDIPSPHMIVPSSVPPTSPLSVYQLVILYGITDTEKKEAVYASGANNNASLISMAKNFRSMAFILKKLGMISQGECSYTISVPQINFAGATFYHDDILKHFSWSPASFRKKAATYAWAEEAALQQWSSVEIPGTFCFFKFILMFNLHQIDENHGQWPLYKTWRGIVWAFKPGGGCDTNTTPSFQANSLDERCASQLTQHSLFTERTHLKQLLR